MKKATRIWLLAATILAIVGAVIFLVALATVDFDLSRFSTGKLETNTYEFDEDFENVFVNEQTATITFVPADDGVCKVECVEEEKLKHSVKIQEGTLMINVIDSRKWYDYIGINFKTPAITVKLPKDVYTSLSVATVTGDIEISDRYSFDSVAISGTTSNISCYASVSKSIDLHTTTGDITIGSTETESVKLTATTGNITIRDVSCNNLTAKGTTAEINLNHVIAKESLLIESTTGNVKFARSDAGNITVKTSTGYVKGTLLSEKIFVTDTATGKVRVPKTTSGGKCEITTSTGDIEIELE